MENVIKFAKRCDTAHQIAARSDTHDIPAAAAEAAENMTFEVFESIARISNLIEPFKNYPVTGDWRNLAITLHLINTVRMPRMAKLADIVDVYLLHSQDRTTVSFESDTATTTKGDGNDGQTTKINNLPDLVREEVTSAFDRFVDQMGDKMQELIQDAVRREMQRQETEHAKPSSWPWS